MIKLKSVKKKTDIKILILNNFNELLNLAFLVDAVIELTPINKIINQRETEIRLSGRKPRVVVTA